MSNAVEHATGWRDPKPVIEEMARRIAERFHPEQIILFGSHATRRASPEHGHRDRHGAIVIDPQTDGGEPLCSSARA
mgnify:CR=1 FL=1